MFNYRRCVQEKEKELEEWRTAAALTGGRMMGTSPAGTGSGQDQTWGHRQCQDK